MFFKNKSITTQKFVGNPKIILRTPCEQFNDAKNKESAKLYTDETNLALLVSRYVYQPSRRSTVALVNWFIRQLCRAVSILFLKYDLK